MATRERVILECDICGRDENALEVHTHTLIIDGYSVEAEVCIKDWERALKGIAPLSQRGRPIAKKRSTVPKAVPWPGSSWKFTSHALQRMGERNLNPMKVVQAAEDPETTHPGKLPESTVHVRGNTKAVVNADRHVIISAARRDDEDVD